MKKYLFILLLFLSFAATAQVKIIRVADATTAIGANIPAGTQVYNIATEELWIATNAVLSTATLTTGSASFKKSGDDLGSHTATEDLALAGNDISSTGNINILPNQTTGWIWAKTPNGLFVDFKLGLYNSAGTYVTQLLNQNITQNQNIEFPNIASGTFAMEADASGFDGNLGTGDNTVQEIAQKFDDIVIPTDTNLSIATTGEIDTGTNDSKAISPLGLASSQLQTDVTTNNAKVTFPGFTSLLTDYSFTDNSTNWNNAFTWGDHSLAGYGDVTKVGTPVNNYLPVWTGDGTLEGNSRNTINSLNLLRVDPVSHNKLGVGTGAEWFTLAEKDGYGALLWFASYDGTTDNLFARHSSIVPIELVNISNGIELNSYVNNGDDTTVGAKTNILKVTSSEFQYLGSDILVDNPNEKRLTFDKTKKWVIFGDSFTNSLVDDYPKEVIDILGLTGTVTHSVGGDKLSDQIVDLEALISGDANYFDDFDIVSLHIGVNDYASSIALGDLDDTSADATFIGQLKDFIEIVLTSNPSIEIYVITPTEANSVAVPYKTVNTANYKLEELAQIMVKVAAQMGAKSIDLNSIAQFNLQTISTYTIDDLHPSQAGQDVIAPIIADAFINKTTTGNTTPTDNYFRTLGVRQGTNSTSTNFIIENTDTTLLNGEDLGSIEFKTNDTNSGYATSGAIRSVLEDNGFWYGLAFDVRTTASNTEALRLNYDGVVSAPAMTNSEIDAKGNTALITKDYFDTNSLLLPFTAKISKSSLVSRQYANRALIDGGVYESVDAFDNDLETVTTENIQLTPNAVKKDVLYALEVGNPITGTAADFDYARASTATKVNVNGLVTTVSNDVPRVDYSVNESGELLLEPSSTNDFTRSNEFDNAAWFKSGATITANAGISPDGTNNAFRLEMSASSNNLYQLPSLSANTHTLSVWVKNNGAGDNYFRLRIGNNTSGNFLATDNWVRYTYTAPPSGGTVFGIRGSTVANRDLLIYGAQIEELDYATSYIPTTTAAVTRSAEMVSGSGNTTLINSQEGVLYIEAAALYDDVTDRHISLSDGTTSNQIVIGYDAYSNRIEASLFNTGAEDVKLSYVITDETALSKIAFKWAETDFALWIDGTEVGTNTSSSVDGADTYTELQLADGDGTNPFIGRLRELKVFTTALSDTELTALTSKDDYTPKHLARTDVDPYFTKSVTIQRNLNVEGAITAPARFTTQAGTTDTLATTDAQYTINYTSASAKTITIPTNATDAIPIGTTIYLINTGAGDLTFSTTGITLNDDLTNQTLVQYAKRTLIKTDTDTWLLAY